MTKMRNVKVIEFRRWMEMRYVDFCGTQLFVEQEHKAKDGEGEITHGSSTSQNFVNNKQDSLVLAEAAKTVTLP